MSKSYDCVMTSQCKQVAKELTCWQGTTEGQVLHRPLLSPGPVLMKQYSYGLMPTCNVAANGGQV